MNLKILAGWHLLQKKSKIKVLSILLFSIGSGFIDIIISKQIAQAIIGCQEYKTSCSTLFGPPMILFCIRAVLALLISLYSAYSLNCVTRDLLSISTKNLLYDTANNAQSKNESGIHNLTHDIPHFTHLYYNSVLSLIIEFSIFIPISIYFLIISNNILLTLIILIVIQVSLFLYLTRKPISKSAKRIQNFSKEFTERIQISIRQAKEYYANDLLKEQSQTYTKDFKEYSRDIGLMFAFSTSQKSVVELILVISIFASMFLFTNITLVSPESVTALGILLYRLVPSIGRISSSLGNIQHSISSVFRLINLNSDKNHHVITTNNRSSLCNDDFKSAYKVTCDGSVDWSINLNNDQGLIWITGDSGVGKTQLLESFFSIREHSPVITHRQNIIRPSKNLCYIPQFPENTWNVVKFYFEGFSMQVETLAKFMLFPEITNKIISRNCDSEIASSMSGGEKYKVAILRSSMQKFKIMLIDEPFASLDKEACITLMNHLAVLSQDCLIFIVSHQELPYTENINIRKLRISK